jgi:limonene 1,2-monooxygenase
MTEQRMRFGAFIAPHVPPDVHPAIALDYNLDLVRHMDKLHYDEAWIGEHHSGGWEIIGSPEVFIAAASQHTKTIKFGTGVNSIPYHNIYTLADRIRQLEYVTRGRIMFGMGPGSLPSDAYMQGIVTADARDILEESIEPLVRLLRGETVTMKGKTFNLQEARLQFPPYTAEGPDIATASQVSPTGARMCGKFGLSMLSLGATSSGGFNALAANWKIAEDAAAEHGKTIKRSGWRLVGPVHIAETREKARENVRYGLQRWVDYMAEVASIPLAPPPGVDPVDHLINMGFAVIGTPDDFVAQIARIREQAGDFGAFLNLDHHWADSVETFRSYELIAKYAIPKINSLTRPGLESEAWIKQNHEKFRGEMSRAVKAKIDQYAAEKGNEALNPDIVAHFEETTK